MNKIRILKPIFYIPHPLLTDFISHIMIFEAKFTTAYCSYSPFPPTPQHAIHFYPRDPVKTQVHKNLVVTSPDSIIVGPQVSKVDIAMGAHHLIVSVAFHPGGLYRLLKTPLYELYDRSFDTREVLGKDINEVHEKLKEAGTALEMKNIVEHFFIRKVHCSSLLPYEYAMKAQLEHSGTLSIEAAASLSCLGLRQFERKTKQIMGYSPKVFSRLIRFSRAYRLKECQPKLSWTAIAHTTGYFDQMHLIRDFKEFTGSVPGLLTKQIITAPFLLQEHMKI